MLPTSDVSTSSTSQQPHDAQQPGPGHGRHRGAVSAHDTETAPRGRHRKPAEQPAGARQG
jgi:hypothetical protein